DYCIIERDKNAAFQKLVKSERIFVLTGFIPEIRCEKLKRDIEDKYDAAVILSDPDEDDDVPVVLKNNGFAAPVETITEMYSLPGKNDIDPTPIMAFFYYFFFGMMLSDAGYGLIMSLALGFVLLKFKMEEHMRNTVKMYFFCGLSTLFWGAMYGSWFGDMPNVIGSNFFGTDKFANTAIWLSPLDELMTLLVYCFIFGLVHLFVGVGIKTYMLWKSGHKFDGLCEFIPTFVLILGFCPIFFGLFTDIPQWMSTIGTPILIAGVVLVVATAGRSSKSIVGKIGGGLYGLYNLVSGYLGDVLSYARLLALGLSTGVIAQVVNMLCVLPSNNVLKLIMIIVVGAVGHTMNLGINLIGAYVHTNRLQYVEFFSKFYDGGGRAMHPLKINTKYYKFKEEN
ncbi:MAG: V-type ATP synthase subunit I, partial [Clostridiales bacterium]|nr:V-type ATP synthase subunit I [Clostridiales bacterium]